MSNYLAVATVTAVLRDMLQEAAGAAVPGAIVTTRRPEAVNDGGQHKPSVNIFLYLVTPNPAWRNTDIEIRYPDPNRPQDRARERIEKRPQVPLNLSYLFSFYGNELELEPHRLLGSVVSAIHTQPRLSLQAIRSTVGSEKHLSKSDLEFQVAQVENVTLTPIGLSLEELSKLWSVFFQVPYALSVAYQASAVLIETGAPPQKPGVAKVIHLQTQTIITFTLTYTAGPEGSLSGETTQVVAFGEDGRPVKAVPDAGYHFVNWSDGSTANPRTDTNVTENLSVTANFALETP